MGKIPVFQPFFHTCFFGDIKILIPRLKNSRIIVDFVHIRLNCKPITKYLTITSIHQNDELTVPIKKMQKNIGFNNFVI